MPFWKKRNLNFICLSLIVLFCSGFTVAEEYIIGPEDELKIDYWQDPVLNQTVVVRMDGKITVSVIGEIQAAGLTSEQLSDQIGRNVSLYHQKVSQAAVTVIGFNSHKVFVSGQVVNPGKLSFEIMPDIWMVIKEAGGATELGDLTRVTIIRSKDEGGERITVNILEAIATGKVANLPKLRIGDTIEIPRTIGGLPGRQLAGGYGERNNLFYIIGQVNQPGHHGYLEEMDILDAIGLAGGTTSMANLKDVQIISKNGIGTTVIKANLQEYRDAGVLKRIKIKREDTIVIGQKGQSFISWENMRSIATFATTLMTLYIIIDSQRDDGTTQ